MKKMSGFILLLAVFNLGLASANSKKGKIFMFQWMELGLSSQTLTT